jgi:hypothetical protein
MEEGTVNPKEERLRSLNPHLVHSAEIWMQKRPNFNNNKPLLPRANEFSQKRRKKQTNKKQKGNV